ncbi:hypothetical protein N7486_002090 [Penicillium sp. IBT 16267x]|nr:hypothetical protein N7486_002090 [Penicillium sp. IBT 16267x]
MNLPPPDSEGYYRLNMDDIYHVSRILHSTGCVYQVVISVPPIRKNVDFEEAELRYGPKAVLTRPHWPNPIARYPTEVKIGKLVDQALIQAPKFIPLEEKELNSKFAHMTDSEKEVYLFTEHELDHVARFHWKISKEFKNVHKGDGKLGRGWASILFRRFMNSGDYVNTLDVLNDNAINGGRMAATLKNPHFNDKGHLRKGWLCWRRAKEEAVLVNDSGVSTFRRMLSG